MKDCLCKEVKYTVVLNEKETKVLNETAQLLRELMERVEDKVGYEDGNCITIDCAYGQKIILNREKIEDIEFSFNSEFMQID